MRRTRVGREFISQPVRRLAELQGCKRLQLRDRSQAHGGCNIRRLCGPGDNRGRDQRVEVLAGLLRALPEADQRCLEGAAGILESVLRPARQT